MEKEFHFRSLFPWLIGGYAWQVHDFWTGVWAMLGYCLLVMMCNMAILFSPLIERLRNPDPWFLGIKLFFFLLFNLTIALSGAEACWTEEGGQSVCRRIWGE